MSDSCLITAATQSFPTANKVTPTEEMQFPGTSLAVAKSDAAGKG